MFSYITGTLEEIREDGIVLDHDGIGFSVFMPQLVIDRLPRTGMTVKIYTYFQVREDGFSLFGFLDQDTKHTFELLIGVNGIGPKNALSVLSTLSVEELRFAIAAEDAKAISKVPGVGGKTAQRIILDLKDKIDVLSALDEKLTAGETAMATGGAGSVRDDAILALVSLGYSQTESFRAVQKVTIEEDSTTEDVLKEALKTLTFL